MKRFPSKHGAPVVFNPVRSRTPMPSRIVPRSPALPRDLAPRAETGPKPRSPSYVELDVVEADLKDDPRYDSDDRDDRD